MSHIKVALTGAAGQIGYALLMRLASGQVFGSDVSVDLHLLEVTPAMDALRGVVMELEDCAFPLVKNIVMTDDVNVAMKDIDWAILVGAMPRKAGMERADLLEKNANIFSVQGKAINDHAKRDVKVFVVGNPCNTNAYIVSQHAPDINPKNIFAMTMLDQNRAYGQLALRAKAAVTEIENMVIWGNHSATQYPDFYNATIAGKPVVDVIGDLNWLQNEFITTIQKRGAAIIQARGASSAASAANGIVTGIQALLTETAPGQSYSMCCYADGEYGVDKGLYFSFPCRTESAGCRILTDWQHNDFAEAKLQATLDELRKERDTVDALATV